MLKFLLVVVVVDLAVDAVVAVEDNQTIFNRLIYLNHTQNLLGFALKGVKGGRLRKLFVFLIYHLKFIKNKNLMMVLRL
jgi:hypothetical protein